MRSVSSAENYSALANVVFQSERSLSRWFQVRKEHVDHGVSMVFDGVS